MPPGGLWSGPLKVPIAISATTRIALAYLIALGFNDEQNATNPCFLRVDVYVKSNIFGRQLRRPANADDPVAEFYEIRELRQAKGAIIEYEPKRFSVFRSRLEHAQVIRARNDKHAKERSSPP